MSFENVSLDDYNRKFQVEGDDASVIFGAAAAKTWDHEGVQIMNVGNNPIATTTIPEGYVGIVHSATGDNSLISPEAYAESLIDKLTDDAITSHAKPWAFACCVDAHSPDLDVAKDVSNVLTLLAKEKGFAYMNGEYAILGDRVSSEYKVNIGGMMLSILPKNQANLLDKDVIMSNQLLFMNSDGVGTKPEFSEVRGVVRPAIMDSCVMKADDAGRVGSRILYMHDILELSREPIDPNIIPNAQRFARDIGQDGGFSYTLMPHVVEGRFFGFAPEMLGHNVSGNVIGELNPDAYARLNSFEAGNTLLAIVGIIPNPRSNGISARRTFMRKHFGEDYHKNPECEEWIEYLSSASTLLYPMITKLNDKELITFMTHMSGGALEGKLLSKLAKKGMGCELHNLPEPNYFDKRMIEMDGSSVREGYRAWPMGIDGIVATADSETTTAILQRNGFKVFNIGTLEKMQDPAVSFKAYDGTPIEYRVSDKR